VGFKTLTDANLTDGQLMTVIRVAQMRDNLKSQFRGVITVPNSYRFTDESLQDATALAAGRALEFDRTINILDGVSTSEQTFMTVRVPNYGDHRAELTVAYTIKAAASGGSDTTLTLKTFHKNSIALSNSHNMAVETSGEHSLTNTLSFSGGDDKTIDFRAHVSNVSAISSLTLTAKLGRATPFEYGIEF
jgi:hypothetical protein